MDEYLKTAPLYTTNKSPLCSENELYSLHLKLTSAFRWKKVEDRAKLFSRLNLNEEWIFFYPKSKIEEWSTLAQKYELSAGKRQERDVIKVRLVLMLMSSKNVTDVCLRAEKAMIVWGWRDTPVWRGNLRLAASFHLSCFKSMVATSLTLNEPSLPPTVTTEA